MVYFVGGCVIAGVIYLACSMAVLNRKIETVEDKINK